MSTTNGRCLSLNTGSKNTDTEDRRLVSAKISINPNNNFHTATETTVFDAKADEKFRNIEGNGGKIRKGLLWKVSLFTLILRALLYAT